MSLAALVRLDLEVDEQPYRIFATHLEVRELIPGATESRALQLVASRRQVLPGLRRRPQSDDFGMGCGVVPCHRGVAASGNQLVATHQHSAHRHLTSLRCSLRLVQSQAHPVLILHKVHCYYFDSCSRLFYKR